MYIKQGSNEWYEARRKLVTASEFAAAIGLSPYQSKQSLWREKTGRQAREPENWRKDHGKKNEAMAIKDYEVLTGNVVERCGLVIHPVLDWMGGSPDGLVGGGTVIEAKCPVKGHYPGIPEYYMPQVQGVMAVTERNRGHFFSWFEGSLRIWEVKQSHVYFQVMHELLIKFRDCITNDTPSPRAKKPVMPSVEYEVIYNE